MGLLIAFPAAGGLIVGLVSRYLFAAREGHGIVDVMESVVRTSGFKARWWRWKRLSRPGDDRQRWVGRRRRADRSDRSGIANGIGLLFRVARSHMPVLIGCGSAAGSARSLMPRSGGVIFTLEVILQDSRSAPLPPSSSPASSRR